MGSIALMIDVKESNDSLVAEVMVKNISTDGIRIGKLNVSNIGLKSVTTPHLFAPPWFSIHVRNSGEVVEIPPDGTVSFVSDLIKYYRFPEAGKYQVWAVYDSVGFKERFSMAEKLTMEHYGHLGSIDEIRAHSDPVTFQLTDSLLQANRERLRTL